ncbi:hypothetical protein QBC47DRAFT_361981 [Echria macrotheca]|uniref:Uncharacterized protein n=1 Tax=Echria macrotheca TaxID=438768 RepID=A0AAJ0F3X6_9PEZI|nr:hypothetical protein QBC47DRAFT_361981 [Echria macrotheca]
MRPTFLVRVLWTGLKTFVLELWLKTKSKWPSRWGGPPWSKDHRILAMLLSFVVLYTTDLVSLRKLWPLSDSPGYGIWTGVWIKPSEAWARSKDHFVRPTFLARVLRTGLKTFVLELWLKIKWKWPSWWGGPLWSKDHRILAMLLGFVVLYTAGLVSLRKLWPLSDSPGYGIWTGESVRDEEGDMEAVGPALKKSRGLMSTNGGVDADHTATSGVPVTNEAPVTNRAPVTNEAPVVKGSA